MKTQTKPKQPLAAKQGENKTVAALFDLENDFTPVYFTLTPEFRSRVRAAVKAAKKIDAIIRVRIPAENINTIEFESLPAETVASLEKAGISEDVREGALEVSIPKKFLKPAPKAGDSGSGYFVEVGGEACDEYETKTVLLYCGEAHMNNRECSYTPIEESILLK